MNPFIALALMAASTIAIPAPSYQPTLKAVSAMHQYPGAALLGSSIEGASCDKSGNIYAVNENQFIDLSNGSAKSLLTGEGGKTSHYSSSRFTKEHGTLIADAVAHEVITSDGKLILCNERMLQPNDMTVNGPETYVYLSGMDYTADTGDLWMLNTKTGVAESCELPRGQIYRTNGIELSPDDSTLYLTSAENSADGKSVVSAKVWKFTINKDTGKPSNPTVAIDLYATLTSMGLDPKTACMDPDGMRMDSSGTLFITLNAFQKVLKWDTSKPCSTSEVIDLETVKYPSNCEFGGPEGKDLVIVGRCTDGKSSCVDIYKHSVPGRAYTNLNTGGSPSLNYDTSGVPKPVDGPKNQVTPSYGAPPKDNQYTSSPPAGPKPPTSNSPPKAPDAPTAPSYGTPPPPPPTDNQYTSSPPAGPKPPTSNSPPKVPDASATPSYGTPSPPPPTDNQYTSSPPAGPKSPTSNFPPKAPDAPATPSYGTPPPLPPMDYHSGDNDNVKSQLKDYLQNNPEVSATVKKDCGKTNPTMDDMVDYIISKNGDINGGDGDQTGNKDTTYKGNPGQPDKDKPATSATPVYGPPPTTDSSPANGNSKASAYNAPAETDDQKAYNSSPQNPPPDNYNSKSPNPSY